MLLRNGEVLNLVKNLDETESWVKKELINIQDSSKPYVIKSKLKLIRLEDQNGSIHIDPRNISVPTRTTFVNPKTRISETWQYVEHASHIKHLPNGELKVENTRGFRVSTNGTVNGRILDSRRDGDAEIIFFLTQISSSGRSGKFYLEDKEAEAKKLNEAAAMEYAAKNLILSHDSPISFEATGEESFMRQMALMYNVPDANYITYSELKIMLIQALDRSNSDYVRTRKGYKEFIDDVHRVSDVEKISTIALAIERGVLLFRDNVWSFRDREGGYQFLISIPPEEVANKDSYIKRHLMRKDQDSFYKVIESLISDPISERLLGLPDFASLNKDALLKYCKEELEYPHQKIFGKGEKELRDIAVQGEKYKE